MYYGVHTRVMKLELIMHVELGIVFCRIIMGLIIEQPESYVTNYQCKITYREWLMIGNSMKYRVDKPIADILEMLVKEDSTMTLSYS